MIEGINQSLFSSVITNVTTPKRYSAPKIRKYNENSDPYEYVCHFEQKMQTISLPIEKLEVIKCKTFTQGLSRLALLWFYQLSSGTIKSYVELTRKFIDNFSINVKISTQKKKKKPKELFTILQGAREPLKKYVERLNLEYVNIPNCLESIAILAFKIGLLQGLELKKYLTTRPSFNLEEVMSTFKGFIKVEDEKT